MEEPKNGEIQAEPTSNQQTPTLAEPQIQVEAKQPIHKRLSKKWTILLVAVLLLLVGGATAWAFMHKSQNKPSSQSSVATNTTKSVPANPNQNQLCFISLAHIVCVNDKGQNRTRYDVPALQNGQTITSLSAMPDQSQYVALFSDGKNSSVWVLNSKLEPTKQLTIDKSLVPSADGISFADNGKSVLLELDKETSSGELENIYKYDLSSDKLTQLSKQSGTSRPRETKDGHILYGYYNGSSGSVYVMNADGTGARQLNLAPIEGVTGGNEFSYDALADKVLVFGWDNQTKKKIGYADSSTLISGKAINIIPTEPDQYFSAFFTKSNTIMAFEGAKANIIDLNGKILTTVDSVGEPIGLLDPSGFKKSSDQTDQLSEKISGYSSAPADFQAFIKPHYEQEDAQCVKDTDGTFHFSLSIIKVVRDTFAQTGESCQDGGNVFYKKINGTWTKTSLYGQSISSCSDVNKYAFTKEIIQTCESNGQIINNTNP